MFVAPNFSDTNTILPLPGDLFSVQEKAFKLIKSKQAAVASSLIVTTRSKMLDQMNRAADTKLVCNRPNIRGLGKPWPGHGRWSRTRIIEPPITTRSLRVGIAVKLSSTAQELPFPRGEAE
jgi:hypothetical protein